MTPAIVVVGSINADLSVTVDRLPGPGETVPGSSAQVYSGGKGANQAVAAAKLGGDVAMVGAVGEDAYAAPALAGLKDAGVYLGYQFTVPGETGLAIVAVDQAGENNIIVIPGANAAMDTAAVEAAAEVIAGAQAVVLQGEIPVSGLQRAAELATGRVVFNLAPAIAVPAELLTTADPLIVNEHEGAAAATQLGVDQPSATPSELAAQLLEAGCRSVVMTLGGAGALVADASGITPIPATPVDVVDTTGAGDAFAGALVAALVAGEELVAAATWAAQVGAVTVTRPGAQVSYPTAAEVATFHAQAQS